MLRVHLYSLEGELDSRSAPKLQAELGALINDLSAGVIVVDCRDVSSIDPAGIRVLMSAQHALESQGRWLRVQHVSEPIRRTFDAMGVTRALRVP